MRPNFKFLTNQTKASTQWVTNITFIISLNISGVQLWGEGEGLPCPSLKIAKTCPDFGQNAHIMCIHGLNFPLGMEF